MANRVTYICDQCNKETTSYLELYKVIVEKLSNCSPSQYYPERFDVCDKCLASMFDNEQISKINEKHQRYV